MAGLPVPAVDWMSLMTGALSGPPPSSFRKMLLLGVICQELLVVKFALIVPTVTPPATSWVVVQLPGAESIAVSPCPLGTTPFVHPPGPTMLLQFPLAPPHVPTVACAAVET